MNSDNETVSQILDVARESLQEQGYARLRYATISDALGITRAGVHHYFPTKVDLAERVMEEYRAQVTAALAAIDNTTSRPQDRMREYFKLYRSVIEADPDRICAGCMLAAEVVALPPRLECQLRGFFDDNRAWVRNTLEQLLVPDQHSPQAADELALSVITTLQGALLLARLYGDVAVFDAAVNGLLESLSQ